MDAYLQHLRSLRMHMNEYEDKAAALNAERHKQETAIRAMETDVEALNAESKRLDNEIEELAKQSGVTSTSILKSQREIAKLDNDAVALSQAFEILNKDILVQSQSFKERMSYYDKCSKELFAQFENYKSKEMGAATEEFVLLEDSGPWQFEAMGGTEAFPNLGKHCSDASCGQLDFLPFTCDACTQVFCLDHRSYKAHSCPKANLKDTTVIVCPFCASGVKTVVGEDPNLTIEKHLQTSCDPSNYNRVMKKPKCTVRGCKELLTFSNKFHCKACKLDTCMKHRFPTDHACQAASKAAKSSGAKQDLASKFLQALSFRTGTECGSSSSSSRSTSTPSSKWPKIF